MCPLEDSMSDYFRAAAVQKKAETILTGCSSALVTSAHFSCLTLPP
jgi:hypothetical protein